MKRLYRIMIAALVLAATLLPAYAWGAEPPAGQKAQSEKGKISIHYSDDGAALENVTFSVYPVAGFNAANELELTDYFSACQSEINLHDAEEWKELAKTLEGYVQRDKVEPAFNDQTDARGEVNFDNLETGLYLICGESAVINGKKYTPLPCLICLPYLDDDGTVQYSAVLKPKKDIQDPTNPTEPTTVTPPGPKTPGSKLPQTGMLQWPVPVASALGLIVFLTGVILSFKTDKKSKKIAGTVFICVGVAAIAAAATLFIYNKNIEYKAADDARELLEEFREQQGEKSVSPGDSYAVNPWAEMPVEVVDGCACVGALNIPALQLELPVLNEWSYDNLKKAPCRWFGTAYRGNMVIAAHNYKTHFGKIQSLEKGDEIIFSDVEGNEFRYQVSMIEILSPYSVDAMKDDKWDLTLFTCTYGGEYRVTVRCLRESI
ncbi:MAG: sortase [Lachnospiraceae bacterium]|nr:sortase [Lachnospiraceae bacterium]